MHVHVEDAWAFEEEMIMNSGHFEAIVQQSRHDWVDFILCQNEVAHHYVHSTLAFGHREPAAEAERRRRRDSFNAGLQIVPGNIDFQNSVLEVPLLSKSLQHVVIIGRHRLRYRQTSRNGKQHHHLAFHLSPSIRSKSGTAITANHFDAEASLFKSSFR